MSAPHVWPTTSGAGVAPARAPSSSVSTRIEGERLVRGWTSPEEKTRVLAWLGIGLRAGRPGRLEREFPLVFADDSAAVPITCYAGTEPAAFCVLWPTRFELARGSLGVGLISLVYTEPRSRGQGLARRVVRQAVAEAQAQALGLCLLWSEPSLADFYRAQGFTRAGSETLLSIDGPILKAALAPDSDASPRTLGAIRVEAARETDWPAILALRAHRACRVALPDDASLWLSIPDLEIRVARSGRGVIGFAMRGRGDDFEGVIHEWGGEPEAVLRCCEALLPDGSSDAGLLLLAPRETCSLTWRLRSAGAHVVRSPLAWFKLACAAALARDLASIAPELAALSLTALDDSSSATPRLRVTNAKASLELEVAAADWLATLFGDAGTTQAQRARARAISVLPNSAKSKLPLPFFVWGLESI